MCRNIKKLFNVEPPSGDQDIKASALQFVRKISGYQKPSKANEKAFNDAIQKINKAVKELLEILVTK
jgi:hypothetical protein